MGSAPGPKSMCRPEVAGQTPTHRPAGDLAPHGSMLHSSADPQRCPGASTWTRSTRSARSRRPEPGTRSRPPQPGSAKRCSATPPQAGIELPTETVATIAQHPGRERRRQHPADLAVAFDAAYARVADAAPVPCTTERAPGAGRRDHGCASQDRDCVGSPRRRRDRLLDHHFYGERDVGRHRRRDFSRQ